MLNFQLQKCFIISTLFFASSFSFCFSQNIKNDSLLKDFISIREHENDSIIKLFKFNKKHQYLTLLPSVSYDALNNSFNVGISFSNFANYFQQRQRNKIELARLDVTLKQNLSAEIEKLNIEIEYFKIELNALKNQVELFDLEASLFEISKGKYSNNEITSEDFLKIKKTFLQKKHSLENSLLKLRLKAYSIDLKTKSEALRASLDFLSNSINNYD